MENIIVFPGWIVRRRAEIHLEPGLIVDYEIVLENLLRGVHACVDANAHAVVEYCVVNHARLVSLGQRHVDRPARIVMEDVIGDQGGRSVHEAYYSGEELTVACVLPENVAFDVWRGAVASDRRAISAPSLVVPVKIVIDDGCRGAEQVDSAAKRCCAIPNRKPRSE